MAKTLKTLKDDLSVRVKTLIAALPYKEEDVELGGRVYRSGARGGR